ncbi:tripartite tricarboxylate transporter permease [Sedimentimonas flavescens]|uniref:Tripartite tricarboxylate transporter permease n=1 Tax=Sedimentimonas flavescens TaxID=2851012 RepID=A0ABT3A0N9_9RHOB|nr:tripartite tricarboxylate transporter permease [Sedimentimonas flavescens]MCV2879407.1 tripartite tricarboxylate transporter permease [Sedimentimonas flavescens]
MDIFLIALADLLTPGHFVYLLGGVVLGLIIGVIPGIGGLFGLTILVPLTYTLDPTAAFSLLLGMASVTTTSDTVPAVLIGVPGTVGAAATVLDGHALAKKGEAARALGAAYSASMIGGVFGAILLSLALPVMRPLVLLLNYGDLLAITIFGLTLVAMLSGQDQLKGLLSACLGALVACVGLDPHEGAERWTFDLLYLWDGVPVAIVFLGIFGIPELAALLHRGRVLHCESDDHDRRKLLQGMGETLRNWRLVLRSGGIGAMLGALPGVGVTVIEWLAYGDAARNRKPNEPEFGTGNIRGVIAPESANNAKEGGSLLPTLAFGIPGSAPMSILLGAFALHGIVPGPRMLDEQAPLVITMILTIALANVLATGFCLGLTPILAKIARVRATTLVPMALVFVVLGAFQYNKDVFDLIFLLAFGVLGIVMRGLGWSRPAFALGFVLGPNLESFFFLSYQISGWDWLTQPLVVLCLAVAASIILRQLLKSYRSRSERGLVPPKWPDLAFLLLLLGLGIASYYSLASLPFAAKVFPSGLAAITAALAAALCLRASLRWRDRDEHSVWPVGADLRFLLLVVALGTALLSLGHLLGPAVFILGVGLFFGYSPRHLALVTLGVTASLWLLFNWASPQNWPPPLLL